MKMHGLLMACAGVLLGCVELAAQTASAIRICVVDDNLPMSTSFPPVGIDVDIARALANAVQAEPVFVAVDHHDEPDAAVLKGECDVAFGAVVDPGLADGRVPSGLALSVPYYAAGYQLIGRRDAQPLSALVELRERRVGVEMESVAIYSLKQRGRKVFALDDADAVIRAVAGRKIDYGYLWGPLVASKLRDRTDVVLLPGFRPEDRWDFSLLLRENEPDLLHALNDGIRQLVTSGLIARIFQQHSVPYLAPSSITPLP